MKGIDVSHYSEPVDWNQAKNQIDFAILKLGNIGDNQKFWLDTSFESNYSECKRLNIPIGVYVYCYCNSPENAKIAGEKVRNYLSDKSLELPVYIDMEDNEIKIEGKDRLTEIIIAFNTEIEKGCKWAGVYANLDWYNNYLHADIIKQKYTTWIAHIDFTSNQDKYNGQYDMFQYSWSGRVYGIEGNDRKVDMNIMYRDLIAEINGYTPEPTPEPQPQKDIDEIVEEVIAGWWGDADSTPTRKERLEAAGYNYEEVRARVNERLAEDEYYPTVTGNYVSIVDGLEQIGVDSSFENRKRIAVANGIYNYTGTSVQNNSLVARLKAGKLKKA